VQQLLHSWEHLNALLLGDCQALVKKPGPGATQLVAAAAEMVNALQAAGKSVKAVGKIGRQRSAQLQYEQEQRQRDKEAAVRSHCRTAAAAQLWLGSRWVLRGPLQGPYSAAGADGDWMNELSAGREARRSTGPDKWNEAQKHLHEDIAHGNTLAQQAAGPAGIP
jgi:hypothetical protein